MSEEEALKELCKHDYLVWKCLKQVSVRKLSRETGISRGNLYKDKKRIELILKEKTS